jgi:acetyl-CoA acetyltransferase
MGKVKIIRGALTKFGKHMDRNLKSLVAEAVQGALDDAGIATKDLQGAWVGNAAQGPIGEHMGRVSGQATSEAALAIAILKT